MGKTRREFRGRQGKERNREKKKKKGKARSTDTKIKRKDERRIGGERDRLDQGGRHGEENRGS